MRAPGRRGPAAPTAAFGLFGALLAAASAGCGAGAPPYAECVDSLDCPAPSDGCYRVQLTREDGTEGDGAFCSARCACDADCPEGGLCVALEADRTRTFFCVQRCALSTDCFDPLRCTPLEGAAGDACLP